eukprot:CAMPEP_0183713314 /NCGR_PEP_ID=MMETSP0737-20130205/8191_1 /TAXON_ID=385413 /ORGANISM="Thalassiosira miniscula, Strain CCMP1093" /LENGTH=391 /DNA_ID=CAMNT_0025942081 /DNA_START=10 /DNA_END=1182 /DNA_ORIENTATION=+
MPPSLSTKTSSTDYPAVRSSSTSGEFAFGIIADVQWADAPDGTNYAKTVRRHYRGALNVLGNAVDWWLSLSNEDEDDEHEPPLSFIAQLGDLIDGKNNAAQLDQTDAAMKAALDRLDRLPCPSVNLVGNHELYNFNRKELAEQPWLRHGDKEYYSFSPAEGWRVIVLDSYQIALIGHDENDPRRLEAVELLARENPNVSPDGADGDWFVGMEDAGYRRRFVPYNGGFGREQLDWFRAEVASAARAGERVLILSHVLLHPKAGGGSTMAWDYEEALEIVRSEEANGCVAAVLCGHDHKGHYHRDEFGVHHCTFRSPLNKGEEGKAFGMMRVSAECLEILGPAVDDLLPDVEERPWSTVIEDDAIPGPCESIKLLLSDANKSNMVRKEEKIRT